MLTFRSTQQNNHIQKRRDEKASEEVSTLTARSARPIAFALIGLRRRHGQQLLLDRAPGVARGLGCVEATSLGELLHVDVRRARLEALPGDLQHSLFFLSEDGLLGGLGCGGLDLGGWGTIPGWDSSHGVRGCGGSEAAK